MFALGGRAFTKSLADRLELPFPRAESAQGRLRPRAARSSDATRSPQIVGEDVAVWAAGVELVMEELGGGDLLPGRIYLCGGGSRLPEIQAALAAERFWKRLPFARPPEVTIMAPDQIETITDATDLLVDQQDVTPLGLAYQAIELQTTEDAARRRAPAGPPGDEGLSARPMATASSTSTSTTRSPRRRRGSGRLDGDAGRARRCRTARGSRRRG